MERKIGEIFEYNGEWYQCVVAIDGCRECSFRAQYYCTRHSECFSDVRSDGISVIFKKLEKVGQPKIINGKKAQFLKSKYCKNCDFWDNNDCTFTTYPRTCMGGEYGVYVEIKQNKEDMEENKLNLKPFDIQKAREGKPVCTRDGRKARIICFDRVGDFPIVALTDDREYKEEGVNLYDINGKGSNECFDLMMLPERKDGWVNVYKERIYSTKEEAIEATYDGVTYVDTVKISWSE